MYNKLYISDNSVLNIDSNNYGVKNIAFSSRMVDIDVKKFDRRDIQSILDIKKYNVLEDTNKSPIELVKPTVVRRVDVKTKIPS